jgi:hypothetical protein
MITEQPEKLGIKMEFIKAAMFSQSIYIKLRAAKVFFHIADY